MAARDGSPPTQETLLTARKFTVVRRVATINGAPHTLEVIEHPGAGVIMPFIDDDTLVLISVYREPLRREQLELPAGTLDAGEDPRTCAARELTEETGYTAATLEPLVDFYPSPGILGEHMHIFIARGLTPGKTAHEAGEQIRVLTMSVDDVLAAVRDGRIRDSKTMIAVLYYDCFRRRGGR